MADEVTDQELTRNLHIIQSMIDVSAERLEGLRTQCATSAELTQQEIRTLEGKLIKMFSDQLVTKLKLRNGCTEHIPSLTQWLQVVGLGKNSIQGLCQRISSVEELQEKSEHELRMILNDKGARPEELSRLFRALHNLKKYVDVLKRGDNELGAEMHLYWDSWDRHHPLKAAGLSPRAGRSRAARASVPSEQSFATYNNNNHRGGATIPPSPSVSSINSLNAQCGNNVLVGPTPQLPQPLTPPPGNRGKGAKFPTTPPPRTKYLTGVQSSVLVPENSLTKSKSHESQLAAMKGDNGDTNSTNETCGNTPIVRRGRLPTEPGPDTTGGYSSPILTSPIKSPPYNNTGTDSDDNSYKSATLQVPKSPRTPTTVVRNMTHQINHRFTKTFKMKSTCGYCTKPIYFGTGLKCKDCKFTCHRDCEDKVTPSCGLSPELLDEFKKITNEANNTQQMVGRGPKNFRGLPIQRKRSHPQPVFSLNTMPPDSSSNTSSCNSSTPSSPAVQSLQTPHNIHKQQFHFPEVSHSEVNEVTLMTYPLKTHTTSQNELTGSQQSKDSDQTVSISGSTSTDSDKTPVRVDSQDSQISDTETVTDGNRWPRQNSLSMREWDIPYHDLKIGEKIGTGRFGTVYKGYWHGDVAIKVLNYINEDEKTLEHFKAEVATFRKTRHENLILFMGACMKPPVLAIVTSYSKGMTLYTHIHLRKDKFNMNKTTIVAQQISQGMGYLHAKGIIHKDLKSKNIFLENGKVVITDFGLFSVTKLCYGNRKNNDSLGIPPGWLCYLSPEIIRSLRAHQSPEEELPFSTASDVYAFGTVWYELLCGEWPFKGQPPEAIIWQVGKGMKQPLANLQASRDVKGTKQKHFSVKAIKMGICNYSKIVTQSV